jgi:hypothetical protein
VIKIRAAELSQNIPLKADLKPGLGIGIFMGIV